MSTMGALDSMITMGIMNDVIYDIMNHPINDLIKDLRLWMMLQSSKHLTVSNCNMSTMGTLDTMITMGIMNDVINNLIIIKISLCLRL